MRVWVLALAVFLSGCMDIPNIAGPAVEPADDALLRQTFDDVRAGNFSTIEARLDPRLRTPQLRPALEQVRQTLASAGGPCTRTLIGATTFREVSLNSGHAGRRLVAQHKYACPHALLVVDARLTAPLNGPAAIEHFMVTPYDPQAVARAESFDFAGKSWRHYVFAGLTALAPLLIVIAFFGALFTRGLRWWAPMALVGLCKFSMVWTTGAVSASWFLIQVLGVGVTRGGHPLAPWVLSFPLPLGALIVLTLLLPRWAGFSFEAPEEPPPPSWPPN